MTLPSIQVLESQLSDDQRTLLGVVNDAFWYEADDVAVVWVLWKLRTFHQLAWSKNQLVATIQSMPSIEAPYTAVPIRMLGVEHIPSDESAVRGTFLGLAASRHKSLATRYIETVATLARRVASTEPSTTGKIESQISGAELREHYRATGEPDRVARAVAKLFISSGLNQASSGTPADLPNFSMRLGLSITDFVGVKTADEYLGVVCRRNPYIAASAPLLEDTPLMSGVSFVVDPELITRLEKVPATTFSTRFLVGVIREINACFASGSIIATLLLMRTILNHVPPIFGESTFEAVVGQANRSVKKSHANLQESLRNVADLHAHQIAKKAHSYPSSLQVESYRADFEILLQQVAEKLEVLP
jgi:hypothetical protein